MEIVEINTPFIKLDQAIKKIGWVASGVDAKLIIQTGDILVNGKICLMRGKKLYAGDFVQWEEESFKIKGELEVEE